MVLLPVSVSAESPVEIIKTVKGETAPEGEIESNARTDRFIPHPVAVLQTLDKVTGRTQTQEVEIGQTVQFGPLFGVVRTCRKSPPIEEPEAAAFIQVWEPILSPDQPDIMEAETRWVFSGWMFASSPALSAMDHPIYDIWVLDCKNELTEPEEKSDSESETSS